MTNKPNPEPKRQRRPHPNPHFPHPHPLKHAGGVTAKGRRDACPFPPNALSPKAAKRFEPHHPKRLCLRGRGRKREWE